MGPVGRRGFGGSVKFADGKTKDARFLLRIYQNPIHLNGTRWRTTFWRQREVRGRKKR